MSKKKFYTARGWLTPYAMLCGYVHSAEIADRVAIVMEYESSGVYSVTVYRSDVCSAQREDGTVLRDGIEYWECFSSIVDARTDYSKQVKSYFPKIPRHYEKTLNRKVFN